MSLFKRMRGERLSVDDVHNMFSYNGIQYGLGNMFSQSGTPRQDIENNFEAYVANIATREGVVAGAVAARALLLSQLRFKFRSLQDGPQAQLFGTEALLPLERFSSPLTRERFLIRAEQHASYSGTAYIYKPLGGTTRLLNPDRVSLIVASDMDEDTPADQLDGELVGYIYTPDKTRAKGTFLPPSEVVQWAPEPHPQNPWIGQSWVTSVMTEIMADRQISDHSSSFYGNAATPNLIFTFAPEIAKETIAAYGEGINANHAGASNAGKNLFVGHGATPTVVGAKLSELNLRDTQGGYESRIAARARVPATVLGIREGMQGSALNSGNYNSARRMWSDGWFSPTADGLCSALAPLIDVPNGSELTFDPSRVMFLQEDRKDEAEIQQANAVAIKTFVEAGYTADSAREAVRLGDLSQLTHSGLVSVQLQPPGQQEAPQ